MQDIYISIGQNIRRRRKEKHLTQESLAANVETSAQYISRIERGQVCPSLEFLYRLSVNRPKNSRHAQKETRVG